MKILGLVVFLIYITCCLAAANRTTMWFLADSLVYSSNKGYQPCPRSATYANTSLLTTTYFRINSGASSDALYYKTLGGTAGAAGNLGATYILNTLQLIFMYGDSTTPNLSFNLPTFTGMSAITRGDFSKLLTSVIVPGTYTSASGATWLNVRIVSANGVTSAGPQTVATATPTSLSVLITDYRSGSTIAVTQFQDGDDTVSTNSYNHQYSVIVRTATSYLTTSTDILVAGCIARASGNANQAAIGLTTLALSPVCTTAVAGSTDTSFSANSAAMCTDTGLVDGVNSAVTSMNSLRAQDNSLFSAAGSKFPIASNFGVLFALSSIVLSIFH